MDHADPQIAPNIYMLDVDSMKNLTLTHLPVLENKN